MPERCTDVHKERDFSVTPSSPPSCLPTAVRGGFLRLAEALAYRRDADVTGSTVCALIASLKSGENYNVEPEVVSKGGAVLFPAPSQSRGWEFGKCANRESSLQPLEKPPLFQPRTPSLLDSLTQL